MYIAIASNNNGIRKVAFMAEGGEGRRKHASIKTGKDRARQNWWGVCCHNFKEVPVDYISRRWWETTKDTLQTWAYQVSTSLDLQTWSSDF